MMSGHSEKTITALSTPPGQSGIAVVRMSGSEALHILSAVLRPGEGAKTADGWEHRRVYHGRLVDDNGEVVDDVLCSVMRGPESYTGEDVVELSCHGSTLVVERVLSLLMGKGARAAEPGEFTKRAFLNGKMDLIQAEAVSDLIHARSELQRRVAHEQLAGGLSSRITTLADQLLELLGIVEANIDFIEEGIDTLDVDASRRTIASHMTQLDSLLASAELARPFHEGYRVVIAGPVNAGKSSLFNRLVGANRAIVTEVPGTTRDVLREPIVREGLLFIVQDTAGLRGTEDRVESIGVGLAHAAVGDADLVVYVLDVSQSLEESLNHSPTFPAGRPLIVALNKSDLEERLSANDVKSFAPEARIVETSAVTGDGVEVLLDAFVESVGRDQLQWIAEERIVLNTRLVDELGGARVQLDRIDENLQQRAPLEILAIDVREALKHYEAATGKRYTDNLLDTIFSRFCIGK